MVVYHRYWSSAISIENHLEDLVIFQRTLPCRLLPRQHTVLLTPAIVETVIYSEVSEERLLPLPKTKLGVTEYQEELVEHNRTPTLRQLETLLLTQRHDQTSLRTRHPLVQGPHWVACYQSAVGQLDDHAEMRVVVDIAVEVYGIEVVVSIEEVGNFDCLIGVALYLGSEKLFFGQAGVKDSSFKDV